MISGKSSDEVVCLFIILMYRVRLVLFQLEAGDASLELQYAGSRASKNFLSARTLQDSATRSSSRPAT
jgi:hypothetical protein